MSKPLYASPYEINVLQTHIMIFVTQWVHTEKTPVPRQEIMKEFKKLKIPAITIEGALSALLRKGYIRRGYSGSNKTLYVQLRNVRMQ